MSEPQPQQTTTDDAGAGERAEQAGALVGLGHALRTKAISPARSRPSNQPPEYDPGNIAIRNEAAWLLRSLGRPEEAEAAFRIMLRVAPTMARRWRASAISCARAATAPRPCACSKRRRRPIVEKIDLKAEVGHELRALRRFAEAEAAYRDMSRVRPAMAAR